MTPEKSNFNIFFLTSSKVSFTDGSLFPVRIFSSKGSVFWLLTGLVLTMVAFEELEVSALRVSVFFCTFLRPEGIILGLLVFKIAEVEVLLLVLIDLENAKFLDGVAFDGVLFVTDRRATRGSLDVDLATFGDFKV